MSKLKTLIESIVTDVINARFEADLAVAELATRYRDNSTMRMMNVPSLNISKVSVDLRVAFDESDIIEADQPSAEQEHAIVASADLVRHVVMGMDSVKRKITTGPARSGLSNSLNRKAVNAATANVSRSGPALRRAVERNIEKELLESSVRLTDKEKKKLSEALNRFDADVSTAPKAPPKSLPGVIVGLEALKAVEAEKLTSIKFDIDLDEARWVDVDDGAGGVESLLSEG